MCAKQFRNEQGFTLIELMTMIVIIGTLATVAGQTYGRFVDKSRVSEAPLNLKQIVAGEILYYASVHLDKNHKMLPKQFYELPPTPDAGPCSAGNHLYPQNSAVWDNNGWGKIQFGINTSHYYQYRVETSGSATSATFTVTAKGDIDCDKVLSTFRVYGSIGADGEPSVQGMVITNDIE